ncbi:cytochrome P450 [Mycena rebaudengoi]|nr:cytochrome P450 [Mycena rebaudengoi]
MSNFSSWRYGTPYSCIHDVATTSIGRAPALTSGDIEPEAGLKKPASVLQCRTSEIPHPEAASIAFPVMVLFSLLASLFGTLGAYLLHRILKLFCEEMCSPLRSIPGPRRTQWLRGNFRDLKDDIGGTLEHEWFQKYGRTLKINGILGLSQLYTRDTRALNHILSKTDVYQKSVMARYSLGRIVGPGILVVEDGVHKQQRKIMNPAFGAPQVRELTGIFIAKSIQLRDAWLGEAAENGGIGKVDAMGWLSKATLDIIGLAGFNYKFNALDPNAARDEFDEAFSSITSSGMEILNLLKAFFPILRGIVSIAVAYGTERFLKFVKPTKRDTIIDNSQEVMMRIGRQLLAESKKEIAEGGAFQTARSRDLLSLLVRANTSKDVPESQRLSDEDVLARECLSEILASKLSQNKEVPTFLVAGHETTSTAAAWALFALTQNVAVQKRLRDELLTGRIAMREDVIPLKTPYTDVNGAAHESVRILKGQELLIPIFAVNRDQDIWGPDALDFKPERWEASTPISNSIPGVWGHMLTFLGGPRGCIGYRFALVELKALLFTLVRGLEFELAVPAADIGAKATAIVQRPIVLSDREGGIQLPLLVKPFVH